MSYADNCDRCGMRFKDRHYTWFVCLDCHRKLKKSISEDETNKEYEIRILHSEELV